MITKRDDILSAIKAYMSQINLVPPSVTVCDCGSQRETAEHFLLHCSTYRKHGDDII